MISLDKTNKESLPLWQRSRATRGSSCSQSLMRSSSSTYSKKSSPSTRQ